MRIFKYLENKHKGSLINSGSLSIGTIEYYRKDEGKKRGDPTEGKYSFYIHQENEPVILTSEEANSLSYDYKIKKGTELEIKPKTWVKADLIVPNVYVFCASTIQGKHLNEKFGEAVYEILDIKTFGNLIHYELSKIQPMIAWISGPVRYVETKLYRITNENKTEVLPCYSTKYGVNKIQLDDYFVKTSSPKDVTHSYKSEYEYRFVFIPKDKPVFPDGKIINIQKIKDVIDIK